MPKVNAPPRLSIQSGIICGLFGLAHPLCKWVDELLPDMPWGDLGKDIARRIRQKIRGKIPAILLKEFGGQIDALKQIIDQIKTVNQLIDDAWDTLQGGELSTLEFCLAGRPPLPDEITWGDVFLAFSRVYPSALLDKLSQIIAFEKFFELCECVRTPKHFPSPELIAGEIVSLSPPQFDNLPTECGQRLGALWENTSFLGGVFELIRSALGEPNSARDYGIRRLFSYHSGLPEGNLIDYEVFLCADRPHRVQFYDRELAPQTYFFTHQGDLEIGRGCCRLTCRSFVRVYREEFLDIKYIYYDADGQVRQFLLSNELAPNPCSDDSYLVVEEYWKYPLKLESLCSNYPEPYPNPDEYDYRRINPINPINPCDRYRDQFGDLCRSCREISTPVRVIRDCQEFVEPRSLFWS